MKFIAIKTGEPNIYQIYKVSYENSEHIHAKSYYPFILFKGLEAAMKRIKKIEEDK
jgi:hypothetical protein